MKFRVKNKLIKGLNSPNASCCISLPQRAGERPPRYSLLTSLGRNSSFLLLIVQEQILNFVSIFSISIWIALVEAQTWSDRMIGSEPNVILQFNAIAMCERSPFFPPFYICSKFQSNQSQSHSVKSVTGTSNIFTSLQLQRESSLSHQFIHSAHSSSIYIYTFGVIHIHIILIIYNSLILSLCFHGWCNQSNTIYEFSEFQFNWIMSHANWLPFSIQSCVSRVRNLGIFEKAWPLVIFFRVMRCHEVPSGF